MQLVFRILNRFMSIWTFLHYELWNLLMGSWKPKYSHWKETDLLSLCLLIFTIRLSERNYFILIHQSSSCWQYLLIHKKASYGITFHQELFIFWKELLLCLLFKTFDHLKYPNLKIILQNRFSILRRWSESPVFY